MTAIRRKALGILSPRQLEVAKLLQRGLSTTAIARELSCEPNTVKAHAARIFAALGISSRQQLGSFKLTHWAGPRVCANAGCGRDFTPAREAQRFHAPACARADAARIRRAAAKAEPNEVQVWIEDALQRVRELSNAHPRRGRSRAAT